MNIHAITLFLRYVNITKKSILIRMSNQTAKSKTILLLQKKELLTLETALKTTEAPWSDVITNDMSKHIGYKGKVLFISYKFVKRFLAITFLLFLISG